MKKALTLAFLLYLRELAKIQLRKTHPTVVGITGSAGKTSLRDAAAAILGSFYKVKVSIKANSESGIPLNILGLKPINYSFLDWLRMALLAPYKLLTNWEKYAYYIVELGIDRPDPPKNMEYLLSIIRPTIGVFLNVLPVHSQYFDKLLPRSVKDARIRREKVSNLIAEEKGKLIRALPKNGTAVVNLDDTRVRSFTHKTAARVITVSSQGNRADLTAKNISVGLNAFVMQVREGKKRSRLTIPQLLDGHYAQTLLAAIGVGRACGISLGDCVRSLEKNFRLPPGRMHIFSGIKGSLIFDSSYNASTSTIVSALQLLSKVAPGRKIAVLGDMRELGKISKAEHQAVAEIAAKTADSVICVGPMMRRWFVPALLALGFPKSAVKSYLNPFRAAKEAASQIAKGDTILVKGSQNEIFLEIVVEKLLKNKKDGVHLCRRGRFWEEKREKLRKKPEED